MRRRGTTTLLLALVLLGGCSRGSDPATVSGVPASWLTDTASGWPGSDAYGGAVPVLSAQKCRLGNEPPSMLGTRAEFTDSGWGGFGEDLEAARSYRYVCSLLASDSYAGEVQLLRVPDAATGRRLTRSFQAQRSTSVQRNHVSTVTSSGLDVLVLQQWIPSNPQGRYRAQYYDARHRAIATLEVNSLDRADYEAFSGRQAADALVAFMASAD